MAPRILYSTIGLTLLTATQVHAGSINSVSAPIFDSASTPNCNVRRNILDKCDASVREHIKNQCYVVLQESPGLTGQNFDCTWQSCGGASIVGDRPVIKSVANPTVTTSGHFEVDEYGIRSFLRVQIPAGSPSSAIPSFACDAAGKCLPFLTFTYPTLSDLNRQQGAKFVGRFYLTVGEAISVLKATTAAEAPARVQPYFQRIKNLPTLQRIAQNGETLKTLSTNPYLDCAMNTKAFVWVIHEVLQGVTLVRINSEGLNPLNYVPSAGKTEAQFSAEIDRELRRTGEYVTLGKELEVCRASKIIAERSHCWVQYEDGSIVNIKTVTKGVSF